MKNMTSRLLAFMLVCADAIAGRSASMAAILFMCISLIVMYLGFFSAAKLYIRNVFC